MRSAPGCFCTTRPTALADRQPQAALYYAHRSDQIFQNFHGLGQRKCAIRIGSYLQIGLLAARLDQEIASSIPIVLPDLELDARNPAEISASNCSL